MTYVYLFSRTVLEAGSPHMMEMTAAEMALYVVRRFLVVFFGSAVIGALFALAAALLLKYVDLRRHPSIEFGIMLVFIYAPYGLAEGIHLSGELCENLSLLLLPARSFLINNNKDNNNSQV